MSAIRRIFSGSVASWLRIGVTIVAQILLVPVYLRYWSPGTYGLWLALIALQGLGQLFSSSFQNYIGNEFLRLAHGDRAAMWSLFFRSLRTGVVIAFLELIVVILLMVTGVLQHFVSADAYSQTRDLTVAMVIHLVSWIVSGIIGGMCVRVLTATGYYSRMAWWSVGQGIVVAAVPAAAVAWGAGFLEAAAALGLAVILYNIPQGLDMWGLLKKEHIPLKEWRTGWAWGAAAKSQAITLRGLLEMLRQQGARLILAPLTGTADLAAFSTMRTGANVALQGVSSITQPLLPELMRFLHQRDQERSVASFATVWLVVAVVLAPGVILLQALAPYLYGWWTLGRLSFDPLLFALLSLGVIVYACAQPAMALVQGHNLMRPQLVIMTVAGGIAVGGMFLVVPRLGLVGAGAALLGAEVVSMWFYTRVAANWLRSSGMSWPKRSQLWINTIIGACGLALLAIVVWPGLSIPITLISLVLMGSLTLGYWRSMPLMARDRLRGIVARFGA